MTKKMFRLNHYHVFAAVMWLITLYLTWRMIFKEGKGLVEVSFVALLGVSAFWTFFDRALEENKEVEKLRRVNISRRRNRKRDQT